MKALVLFLLLGQSGAFAAERPEDFAYGVPIHAGGRDALYEFEIPAAVYRGVSRADLGDLRVFNGQGEVVPHALRPKAAASSQSVPPVSLPVFPVYGEVTERLEDLHVRVEKRTDGTIVSVRGQPAKARASKARVRGYLLDTSPLKQAAQALRFAWRHDAEGFVGNVRIEGSDDLSVWNTVADRAALVRLTFDGHQLEQDRVELRGVKFKYLRLSWPENQEPLEALRVVAEPAADVVSPRRVWQKINGEAGTGQVGEYRYDLGGPFPFDRLRVELPQLNSLAELQILARVKSDEPWRFKSRMTAYRLRRDDAEASSPEIALTNLGARYWLLRVDQKGGGVSAGVPILQIGWIPQKLVFAARGTGPFQLAYGNSAAKPSVFPIDSLIPGYKTEAEFKVSAASLGEPIVLAGPARLRPSVDYKKWALWGSLILGVVILGCMAYRLARQVQRSPTDTTDESK